MMRKCAYTRSEPQLAGAGGEQRPHRCSMAMLVDEAIPAVVYDEKSNTAYEIGHILGKGGFARCYLAVADGEEFALKAITRESISKDSHWRKIRKEIASHFALRHPNIVALYSHFEDRDHIYLLLEYCPNGTLADYIDSSYGHTICEVDAVLFLKQLLKAVRYLHLERRMLHRDIKPGNILLSRELRVKLGDFGFCCSIDEVESRLNHSVCGTPNYVDKQVIDKCGHSVQSESWAVACTFYCMLYGKPPFHSECLEATYSRIRLCDYHFPSDSGLVISSEAKDLIRRTLIPERSMRLTINEMLVHPLLSTTGRGGNATLGGTVFAPNLKRLDYTGQIIHQVPGTLLLQPSIPLPRIPPSRRDRMPINSHVSSPHYSTTIGSHSHRKNANPPPVDSGLGGSAHSSGVNRATGQRLHQRLLEYSEQQLRALEPITDPRLDTAWATVGQAASRITKVEEGQLPLQFITKWVDYTNKFGFGATLKDGTRTVLFNDHSGLSQKPATNEVSYRKQLLADDGEFIIAEDHREVEEKLLALQSLQTYMDTELYSFVKLDESNVPAANNGRPNERTRPKSSFIADGLMPPDINNNKCYYQNHSPMRQQQQLDFTCPHSTRLLHIVDFHKLSDGFLMVLSDGTCQMNFTQSRWKLSMPVQLNEKTRANGFTPQLFLVSPQLKVFILRASKSVNNGDDYAGRALESPCPTDLRQIQEHLLLYRKLLLEYRELLSKKSNVCSSTDC